VFLPSSYKSFREAIIYEGKSIIMVNKHLLNKDKIDTHLTGESHHDESGQVQVRRVIMEASRVTQNIKIWYATIVTRRGTLELIVGFERRNNQMLMSLNWLKKMKISVTFYLLGKKDRWIIDSGYSQHISFNRKMFSLYTSIQRGEVFKGNSNNPVSVSWWMHHYSSRCSLRSRFKL